MTRIEEIRQHFVVRCPTPGSREADALRDVGELLAHIDQLTADRDTLAAQVAKLRGACEAIFDTPSHYGDMMVIAHSAGIKLKAAIGRELSLLEAAALAASAGEDGS